MIRFSWLNRLLVRWKEPARKRKAGIFLLCLLCSSLAWFFIKLSGDIQLGFEQSVRVQGLPDDSRLIWRSDSVISFQLQGRGFRLLAATGLRRDTLVVDVGALARVKRNGQELFFISSGRAGNLLNLPAEANWQILRLSPDTLFFETEQLITREIPVALRADMSFERGFGLYGRLVLDPSLVRVRGPLSEMERLPDSLPSHKMVFPALSSNLQTSILLNTAVLPEGVSVSPEEVILRIPVEEFTQARLNLQPEVRCPDSIPGFDSSKLHLFPHQVELNIRVALREYSLIHANMFKAWVECPQVSAAQRQLEVKLDPFPPDVHLISIQPGRLDYLIEK